MTDYKSALRMIYLFTKIYSVKMPAIFGARIFIKSEVSVTFKLEELQNHAQFR